MKVYKINQFQEKEVSKIMGKCVTPDVFNVVEIYQVAQFFMGGKIVLF